MTKKASPPGVPHQVLDLAGDGRRAGRRLDQRRDVHRPQRPDRQRASAPQQLGPRPGAVLPRDGVVTCRGQEDDRGGAGHVHGLRQQAQRAGVGGVHVVQDQQQGPVSRHDGQHLGDVVRGPQPLRLGVRAVRRSRGRPGHRGPQGR
ncbi:hypothetical protein ACFVTY_08305 [Streptomyces sp. NPDC058067]|uniref:hypothetical protein n=1 Tax=Streptomyces sp. NPDC058067 TaxID=3346324 RepID=UPI0036E235CD